MTKADQRWIWWMEFSKKYCHCHQMPERSFFIKGYQFPLCARCTGIAIGHFFAFIIAPFHTFKLSIVVLALPLALDGTIQYFTPYESSNTKRVISGFLYGFAFTSIMCLCIKRIFRKIF